VQLWKQGHAEAKVYRQIGDGRLGVKIDGKLHTVWRSEVKNYCDDYFWSALQLWYRWRLFGSLPFVGNRGWAEEQARIIHIIEAVEEGYAGS